MAPWGSLRYLEEPLVAFCAVAVLAVVCRWTFSHGKSLVAAPPKSGTPDDYGMLRPVAAVRDLDQAERIVSLLATRGIRGLTVRTTEGIRVMVWQDDVEQAQAALPRPAGS